MALPIEHERGFDEDILRELPPHEASIVAIRAVRLALDLDGPLIAEQQDYENGALILESLVTQLRYMAEQATGRIAMSGVVEALEPEPVPPTGLYTDIIGQDEAEAGDVYKDWLLSFFRANPGRIIHKREIFEAGYRELAGNAERKPHTVNQQFLVRVKKIGINHSAELKIVGGERGPSRGYVWTNNSLDSDTDSKPYSPASLETISRLPFEVKVDEGGNFSVEVNGNPVSGLEGLPALCLSLIIAASPTVSSRELGELLEVVGREIDEKRLMGALNRLQASLDTDDSTRGILTVSESKHRRTYNLRDTHTKDHDEVLKYLSYLRFTPDEIIGIVSKLSYRGR